MTKDDLLRRLTDHEDNFIERKAGGAATPGEIRKTVVAFANTVPDGREAVLYIGVLNNGAVDGVGNPDSLQRTVRQACERCYPKIAYTTEVLPVGDKTVVAVVVSASLNRPHFTGPAFVRVGAESVEASKEMFDDLIFSRNDKCRVILKRKDQVVTVRVRGKKLGHPRMVSDPYALSTQECRILSCDANVLRMYDLATFANVSEPMKNVTIDWDEERSRLALVVQSG
jgi:hypothetical protein